MSNDGHCSADTTPGRPHRVRLFSGEGKIDDCDSPSRELAPPLRNLMAAQRSVWFSSRTDWTGWGSPALYKVGLPAVSAIFERFGEAQGFSIFLSPHWESARLRSDENHGREEESLRTPRRSASPPSSVSACFPSASTRMDTGTKYRNDAMDKRLRGVVTGRSRKA